MDRTIHRNESLKLIWARHEASAVSLLDDFDAPRRANELCIALFDRWCGRRELIPLVYLLHAWPFVPTTGHSVRTLAASLKELSCFHGETLDEFDLQMIAKIHSLAGH